MNPASWLCLATGFVFTKPRANLSADPCIGPPSSPFTLYRSTTICRRRITNSLEDLPEEYKFPRAYFWTRPEAFKDAKKNLGIWRACLQTTRAHSIMPPTYSLLLCIPSEVPAITILPGELSAVRLGEFSGKFRITS